MIPAERVARNRRLADGFIRALSDGPDVGRIEFPPEWTVRPDAIQWLPSVNGGEEHELGRYLVENGLTHSERGTAEFQKFWKHLPDFRVVAHGEPIVDQAGFAVWLWMEGTTSTGTTLGLHEFSIVRTDENGAIARYEAMFDPAQFGALVEVVAGLGPSLTWDQYRQKMK